MVTTFLYLFIFTSWGLGLLSAFTALMMKIQEHGLRISATQRVLNLRRPSTEASQISDELKKLIESSNNHPEVAEIEEDDEIIGVLFKGQNYPPSLDSDLENDED